ncbi:MAG TPA: helix-turn-helix transcriptional regulator [Candidatus Limiplasma sp.]|nr:helix-turn-helix transcriptional regulator [Candidatus Limiplasma sp.]
MEYFLIPVFGYSVDVLYCYETTLSTNFSEPQSLHMHDYFEVHYCVEDETRFYFEHGEFELHHGQALIIVPKTLHHSCDNHTRGYSFVFKAQFPTKEHNFSNLFTECVILKGLDILPIERIRSEALEKKPGYHERLSSYFQLCLSDLFRNIGLSANKPVSPPSHEQYGMIIERWISMKLSSFISAEVNDKDALATALNLSMRQLERITEEIFHMPYSEVFNRHKFSLAWHLLKEQGWKVKDVSSYLGYSNPANFSRAFHAFFGINPTDISIITKKTK